MPWWCAIYVAVTIGMFFNPSLRAMDIRHEPPSEQAGKLAAAQDRETTPASCRTDIH